jgi:hypothetical protein
MKIPSMSPDEVDTNHCLLRLPETISIQKLISETQKEEEYYIPVKSSDARENGEISMLIMDEGYALRKYGIVHLPDGPNMWYGSDDVIHKSENIGDEYIDIMKVSE